MKANTPQDRKNTALTPNQELCWYAMVLATVTVGAFTFGSVLDFSDPVVKWVMGIAFLIVAYCERQFVRWSAGPDGRVRRLWRPRDAE